VEHDLLVVHGDGGKIRTGSHLSPPLFSVRIGDLPGSAPSPPRVVLEGPGLFVVGPVEEQAAQQRTIGRHGRLRAGGVRGTGRLSDGPVRASRAPGRELPGVRPGPTGRRGGWRWPACALHQRLDRSSRPLASCVRASP